MKTKYSIFHHQQHAVKHIYLCCQNSRKQKIVFVTCHSRTQNSVFPYKPIWKNFFRCHIFCRSWRDVCHDCHLSCHSEGSLSRLWHLQSDVTCWSHVQIMEYLQCFIYMALKILPFLTFCSLTYGAIIFEWRNKNVPESSHLIFVITRTMNYID